MRSIWIREFFSSKDKNNNNSSDAPRSRFRISNPNWMPPRPPQQSTQDYINKTIDLFTETANRWNSINGFAPRRVLCNSSSIERAALREILSNQDIIIKPADKNLGLTIVDREWYVDEINRQMSDESVYRQINTIDEKERIKRNASCAISLAVEYLQFVHLIADYEARYILAGLDNPRWPNLYATIKIHKPKLSGRPIVPSHSWITSNASRWLAHQLHPILVENVKWILTDTVSLIRIIEEKTNLVAHKDCIFLTADIESLYTNIPNKDGIDALRQFILRHTGSANRAAGYTSLMTAILHHSCFIVLGKEYHQIDGTAMGTSAAPDYANVFMYILEAPLLEKYKDFILLFVRYIDDILLIVKHYAPLSEIIGAFNSLHPKIKLNFVMDHDRIEFLDLVIFKGPRFYRKGILDIEVHQKITNGYLYIPFTSFHPVSVKKAFIRGELIRYVRNCSSMEQFLRIRSLFFERLIARGYHPHFLRHQFKNVSFKYRHQYLMKRRRDRSNVGDIGPMTLVCSIPFNPTSYHFPLAMILKQFWHYIEQIPSVSNLFRSAPMVSYIRGRTLYNILCKNII